MSLLTNIRNALGTAWHVGSEAFYAALLPAADGTPEASKVVTADANNQVGGADLTKLLSGVAAGYKIARGQATIHPSTAATATVVTGLSTVVAVIVSADSDLDGDALMAVSGTIGDQAGSPAAGSIILKTWKSNGDGDATMVAATADADYKVNWLAIGT